MHPDLTPHWHSHDRHNREYRIGADAVLWQLQHMTPVQLRAALLYISGRDEDMFARAILTGRGLTADTRAMEPVEYIRWEARAGEEHERDHPAQP